MTHNTTSYIRFQLTLFVVTVAGSRWISANKYSSLCPLRRNLSARWRGLHAPAGETGWSEGESASKKRDVLTAAMLFLLNGKSHEMFSIAHVAVSILKLVVFLVCFFSPSPCTQSRPLHWETPGTRCFSFEWCCHYSLESAKMEGERSAERVS